MSFWFLQNPQRLRDERASVDELGNRASWLVGYDWRFEKGLYLDAIIRADAHEYEVRISFPDQYPDTPCVVQPRNADRRWTFHQYGQDSNGPLCLEWGPDNWHPEITVAMMLESTYRLLEKEKPHGGNPLSLPEVVPSRHLLTAGQCLRNETVRWHSGPELREQLGKLPWNSSGYFRYSFRKIGKDLLTLVHEFSSADGGLWVDANIPAEMPGTTTLLNGNWMRTQLTPTAIQEAKTLEQLQTALSISDPDRTLNLDDVKGERVSELLVLDKEGEPHLLHVFSDTILMGAVVRSERHDCSVRAPQSSLLKEKKIAIVGLGSAGSKIAVSLARMGVGNFYLVDYDVLLPENLQRNELDWQNVGRHKVKGVESAIGLVNALARVETSSLHITGQESSAAVAGVLKQLAKCDVIVDATANPRVFNLLAAVARGDKCSMVWLEVFGGGLGGLVGRSRPDVDPIPQDMRRVYLTYCEKNPAPTALAVAHRYDIEEESNVVLSASDSEVGILASHAVRFVADCCLPSEQSKFPYSMYLVGLQEGWVFDQPFCTIPISMGACPLMGWGADNSEFTENDREFLLGLFKKSEDYAATRADENPKTTD